MKIDVGGEGSKVLAAAPVAQEAPSNAAPEPETSGGGGETVTVKVPTFPDSVSEGLLLITTSHRKNGCQKICPAHFMISKRSIIMHGSCFCEKYILCGLNSRRRNIPHKC